MPPCHVVRLAPLRQWRVEAFSQILRVGSSCLGLNSASHQNTPGLVRMIWCNLIPILSPRCWPFILHIPYTIGPRWYLPLVILGVSTARWPQWNLWSVSKGFVYITHSQWRAVLLSGPLFQQLYPANQGRSLLQKTDVGVTQPITCYVTVTVIVQPGVGLTQPLRMLRPLFHQLWAHYHWYLTHCSDL